MTDPITLRNTADAWISPSESHTGVRKIYVRTTNPDTRRGLLYFGTPFPLGVIVRSAKLRLYNGTPMNTVKAQVQRITEKWSRNRVVWPGPSVGGPIVEVTKAGAVPENDMWEFDLTAMMNTVSNGGSWFGVRLTCDDGKGDWFHSSTSSTDFRPVLEIEYVVPSELPENPNPSGNQVVSESHPTLSLDFFDESGEEVISAIRVEMSNTEDFAAITWTSPDVPTTVPELDLGTTSYPGLADGSGVWWRGYVLDATGTWVGPSDPAQFQRKVLQDVGITQPVPDGAGGFKVEDNTPDIVWTATDQEQYQILIRNTKGTVLWNSKQEADAAARSRKVPEKILEMNKDYDLEVRVFDGEDRVQAGDVPPYAFETLRFHVEFDDTVDKVTNLQAEQIKPYHWTKLTWDSPFIHDHYEIYLGNKLVEKVEGVDVNTAGLSFEYIAREGRPRRNNVWSVVGVTNGAGAKNSPTVTTKYKSLSAVLCEIDGSDPIMFFDWTRDEEEIMTQAVHTVIGEHPPILVNQAKRGREGAFSGRLTPESIPGSSAEVAADRFESLREGQGRDLLLTMVDDSFRCFICRTKIEALADAEGLTYHVEFEYYQTDFKS